MVTQTKKLLVLRVVVPRDEDRARRRFWFVERIGAQPGDKCRAVLVAKAALEKLRRLLLTIELGGKPTVEGIAVVDALLSCEVARPSAVTRSRLALAYCSARFPAHSAAWYPLQAVATATTARIIASIISIASNGTVEYDRSRALRSVS